MYNIFAYIGSYVRLYDDGLNYLGCYQVFQDNNNDGEGLQEHYWISSGFTNSGVASYSNCGCSTEGALVVVQEEPSPSPTSTATPTPTPTMTPSPTPTIGLSPTPTPSPTATSVTPTPTGTPTPTPSSTPAFTCECYFFLNETGVPLNIEITECGEGSTTIDTIPGGQVRYY
jgi:hypothetical protein